MSLSSRSRWLTATLALSLVPAYGFVAIDAPLAADPVPEEFAAASENMSHVGRLSYVESGNSAGTDLEFQEMTLVGEALKRANEDDRGDGNPDVAGIQRTFSFAGSYQKGLQIVDVTDPETAEIVGVYDCAVSQGDVQVFQRGEGPTARTFVTYTQDTGYSAGTTSDCYLEAELLGDFQGDVAGTFIADVTNPYAPETVAFIPFAKGSHNQTVHPSGNYLYNSNSELITTALSAGIEIVDISDFRNPKSLGTLALPPRPGLGTESHDITFSEDGKRAYSAALSQTVIIDTEDPAKPSIVTSFVDPAINVEHQANPVTIDDPNLGKREFLIVEDEFAGAAGAEQTCPSGGVHVYDITDETLPVKVGYWNIDDVTSTQATGLTSCTAHVFELHEDEALMTIAFYGMGVSVVDISGLVGVALGSTGVGMKEVAFAHFDDSNTWAVKAPFVDRDGVFEIYGNDQNRGMDIYRVDLSGGDAASGALTLGTGRDAWLSPLQADRLLAGRALPADYEPFCLLGDRSAV